MIRYIRIHIEPSIWDRIFQGTALWPENKRTQASIARYALAELNHGLLQTPEYVVSEGFPRGSMPVQVRTEDEAEATMWQLLADQYGGAPQALNIALASLLVGFETPEE